MRSRAGVLRVRFPEAASAVHRRTPLGRSEPVLSGQAADEGPSGMRKRSFPSGDDGDGSFRDGMFGRNLEDRPLAEARFCKTPYRNAHAEAAFHKGNDQHGGRQFEFGIEHDAVRAEKGVQILPGAGILLRADDGQAGDFGQWEHGILQVQEGLARDEHVVNGAHRDQFQIVVLFHGREHDAQIDFLGAQGFQRSVRRRRDRADVDLGVRLVKAFQIRQQIGVHDHVGGADMDAPPVEVEHGL